MEKHPLTRVAEIARMQRRLLEAGLESKGLTYNKFRVLKLLDGKPHMSPSDLADRMSVPRSSVAVILRSLEKKGWLTRNTDPTNRRSVRVRITPAGREKADEARAWLAHIKDSVDPQIGLSDEDLETLGDLLERVQSKLEQDLRVLDEILKDEQERR